MSSTAGRKMPAQKPGRSESIVGTPWRFIDAVERRFGGITFDLAATYSNRKVYGSAHVNNYYGPGSKHSEDALAQDWNKLKPEGWRPPDIAGVLAAQSSLLEKLRSISDK